MPTSRNDIRNDNEPGMACPVCATKFSPIPPATHRRDITVYQCPTCEGRYLGQQWCHDCHRPCTRLDLGALCPHCDEPITISDILEQHPPRP
jgi:hypothetical protein